MALHHIQTTDKSLTVYRTPLHRESTAETHLLEQSQEKYPIP